MAELSAYVHYPWCERKCPYCDFNSHTSTPREDAYLRVLLADIRADFEVTGPRTLRSVFFGGGTPSLASPRTIAGVLNELDRLYGLGDAEVTLEANPGSSEQAKFEGFKAAGVNRLSLGIQSFDGEALKALGRVHDAKQAHSAVQAARAAGFDNINLDLMHGLPNQTFNGALADLDTALSFEPEHLSWYELTLEPNTVFYKTPPALPEQDVIADLQVAGQARLTQAGFEHYEVSAYTRGRPCQHNLNYWEFGDYLGIGAGAHGKLLQPQGLTRSQKTRQPEAYLNWQPQAMFKAVDETELGFEVALNALRLRQGIDWERFTQACGLSAQSPVVARLQSEGLLRTDRFATTDLGWRYLNGVIERFLD